MYYGLRAFATKDECVAALANSTLSPTATPAPEMVVGGGCEYSSFNGTCKISALDDSTVKFWFSSQDPAVSAKASLQYLFEREQVDALIYFAKTAEQKASLAVNKTLPCIVEIETRGTCTPTIFRLS
jgi:hypothetical protein